MREVACPACRARFQLKDEALSARAGRVAMVQCPFCATEARAEECEREPGRQLAELAKVAARERKKEKQKAARDEKEESRARKHADRRARQEPRRLEDDNKLGQMIAREAEKEKQREDGLEGSAVAEIGALRIVGLGLMVLGVCVAIYLWNVEKHLAATLSGLGLTFVGLVTRCLGGIWATLERIARK